MLRMGKRRWLAASRAAVWAGGCHNRQATGNPAAAPPAPPHVAAVDAQVGGARLLRRGQAAAEAGGGRLLGQLLHVDLKGGRAGGGGRMRAGRVRAGGGTLDLQGAARGRVHCRQGGRAAGTGRTGEVGAAALDGCRAAAAAAVGSWRAAEAACVTAHKAKSASSSASPPWCSRP